MDQETEDCKVKFCKDYDRKPEDVFTTDEVTAAFKVEGFAAPFCVATLRSDGVRGSLEFWNFPRRLYYDFTPDHR